MFTGKLTATLTSAQYLALRYGRNGNSQPSNAGLRNAPESWSTSRNTYNSLNANHNWVRQAALNELIVQYSDFHNGIPTSSDGPSLLFPNGVRAGANPVAPQATRRKVAVARRCEHFAVWNRWPRAPAQVWRDLDPRAGALHTPVVVLRPIHLHRNDPAAPLREIMVVGGAAAANIPLNVRLYIQDDWRVTDRLTLNLGCGGLRDGAPLDQASNPNFVVMQAADALTACRTALDDFGKDRAATRQHPAARRLRLRRPRRGRDVVRGGWGGTLTSRTRTPTCSRRIRRRGRSGLVFLASNRVVYAARWRVVQGQRSASLIASQNLVNPDLPRLGGQVVSPRLEQPYTIQSNLGWTHDLGSQTALSVDYVRADGRDINVRLRPNALVNGRRALADLAIQPNAFQFRTAISRGKSQHDALMVGLQRRMVRGLDVNGWYMLSSSTSNGSSAYDELDANLVQDVSDPFGAVQNGPSTRTDARHRATITRHRAGAMGLPGVAHFHVSIGRCRPTRSRVWI